MPTISRMTGERFGNMPLPIEMSSKAAEGELMVSKTTGHMYIRNGSKNVSKTVELEEFLRQFRVACINGIRNSGEFYKDLAKYDWGCIVEGNSFSSKSFEFMEEEGRTFIRFKVVPTSITNNTWWTLTHYLNNYTTYKKFMRLNTQYCLSFSMRTNISNLKINTYVAENSGQNSLWSHDAISIKQDWTKYEMVNTSKAQYPENFNDNLLNLTFSVTNPVQTNLSSLSEAYIDLEYCQIEPADRSSAWRPSWLDYFQRLDFMNDGLKEWVKEQINKAVTECKEYTDSEIEKLDTKLQNIIANAITECKNYTNEEIKKVNNRINDEVDELIRRDMMQRVHLNLGNQDYTKYLRIADNKNNKVDPARVFYSNDNKGIIIKGNVPLQLQLPIPITEDSKYYISIKFIRLSGRSEAYVGVDSLDANLNSLRTDLATTYNYGLISGELFEEGAVVKRDAIFQGFNRPEEGNRKKFDPFAQYFKLIFMLNYSCLSVEDTVVVKDIEIFEIPKCLWNALDPGPRDRDGLMSVADKTKLDGIEERANRYIHPSGDGNLHVPATGTTNAGKVLTAGNKPGILEWITPSTDAETIDGFDSNKLLREVNAPSSRDCNQFTEVNAFIYMDSGEGEILNTPEGTIASGTSRVVMVINRFTVKSKNSFIRYQQEFINIFPNNKNTRYIRNVQADNGNTLFGPWAKVYTTADKPTTQEINAVNKSGDTMSGNLTFNADDIGINFFNGAKIYKKRGTGLVIKNDNEVNPVVVETYSGQSILNMTKEQVTANGKFKSKNIDLGRFSLKANPDTGALDFIFE